MLLINTKDISFTQLIGETVMTSKILSSKRQDTLVEGMYVRVPVDIEEDDSQWGCRDFYIGRIETIDEVADTIKVILEQHSPGERVIYQNYEIYREMASRCSVLPGTKFVHRDTHERGEVLETCEKEAPSGEFYEYYVKINGKIGRMLEKDLIVPSHRGDPNPWDQINSYEFNHPTFRGRRDQLIECHADLRSATFGIEELLGSRILLLAHQSEVVTKVLSDPQCRYILADEVGLGKTVEACVILKGLRRRHPKLKTLIIAPASLVEQWYFELDQKFWLRFARSRQINEYLKTDKYPGIILSMEEIIDNPQLMLMLKMQQWGLLILDEAHQIRKHRRVFENIVDLSKFADRALILSATPIQHRAEELLDLLVIMDPERYERIDVPKFRQIVDNHLYLLQLIASVSPDLTPEYFSPDDFVDVISKVGDTLSSDSYVQQKIEVIKAENSTRKGIRLAKDLLAYISENYRIDRRMIRNRRANIQANLPERALNTDDRYNPSESERSTFDFLHDYLDRFIEVQGNELWALEYARLLLHAASSSPHALRHLLSIRQSKFDQGDKENLDYLGLNKLSIPRAPRQEEERIARLINAIPSIPSETEKLKTLDWYVQGWLDKTEQAHGKIPFNSEIPPFPYRLARVMRVLFNFFSSKPDGKVVIFSSWLPTIKALKKLIRKNYFSRILAEFHCQLEYDQLQREVDNFQDQDYCQIMLCDELGGEGRNFQIADLIIHVDIPWSPTQIEQRIGRVDRLGRDGVVTSSVIYGLGQVEEDLYNIWQNAFELFTKSMSGLEIALEDIQDKLVNALGESTRNGISFQYQELSEVVENLKDRVEEERYYEEEAINYRQREEFDRLSQEYLDGRKLRKPLLEWANQAGLQNTYNRKTDTVQYLPRQFSIKAMRNAKFADVPNMEEALARSRNRSNLRIIGTFNREIAVVREDLVFFAPGSDPWTDAILENAIEADRGRCCAIKRRSENIDEPWDGFELFYRIEVDPRFLYQLGEDPIHLLRSQGYLQIPVFRILISIDGEVVPNSSEISKITQTPYQAGDVHLGKRGGEEIQIDSFLKEYPPGKWRTLLEQARVSIDDYLADEFSFTGELANEAREDYELSSSGMRASVAWRNQYEPMDSLDEEIKRIDKYEKISDALISGIEKPEFRLESICFWRIIPESRNE
jgi:ATP-dependent helicase HepA